MSARATLRILFSLLVVSIGILASTPAPSARADGTGTTFAAPGDETLTLSPSSGPAGSVVAVNWYDDDDAGPTSGTLSFDGTQIASYQVATGENWTGTITIPASAQLGSHTVDIADDDGSTGSASFTVTSTGPTCGRTLGQHCTAIWTDKSQYQIGDTIQYCYSVPQPAHVTITDIQPGGASQIALDADDDGTGGCLQGTITPPTGTERLHLSVTLNGTSLGSADTSFTVGGSSCAPNCSATLSTDKSQYNVGDPIQICFNPQTPSHVQITFTPPGGSTSVIYDQDDDGTGACFAAGTAQLPAGTRQLHMVVTQGSTVIAQADAQYSVVAPAPTCTPGVPGGVWQSPDNNITTSGPIHFSASAYPSNTCGAPIRSVNFTVWWPALGPQSGPWKTACALTSPVSGTTYACDVDLGALGAPPGQVLVSFDVYDQSGLYNLSPQGEHSVNYAPPSPPTATSTPVPPTATPTSIPPTSTPIPTDTPAPPDCSNWSVQFFADSSKVAAGKKVRLRATTDGDLSGAACTLTITDQVTSSTLITCSTGDSCGATVQFSGSAKHTYVADLEDSNGDLISNPTQLSSHGRRANK